MDFRVFTLSGGFVAELTVLTTVYLRSDEWGGDLLVACIALTSAMVGAFVTAATAVTVAGLDKPLEQR